MTAPWSMVHAGRMVPPLWGRAIQNYLLAQTSAGAPSTTVHARKQHLCNLGAHIGVEDPYQVTGAQLVIWTGMRTWMPETRRSRRTTFLSFYRWAISAGLTDENPAEALERVRATVPMPRPCPESVYERALARARPREAIMLRLAGEMGMRRGEVAVVHSRDVFQDLTGWSLLVHGKGGKHRYVPLTRRLALELRTLPTGYAFPGAIDGHLSPRRVGELIDDALEGDWTMHTLRHRAAGFWRRHGADLSEIQKLLGHASPATTMTYTPVFDDRLRAIIDDAAS